MRVRSVVTDHSWHDASSLAFTRAQTGWLSSNSRRLARTGRRRNLTGGSGAASLSWRPDNARTVRRSRFGLGPLP